MNLPGVAKCNFKSDHGSCDEETQASFFSSRNRSLVRWYPMNRRKRA